MTSLQWFAFVILPVAVTLFGGLLAIVGVKLIDLAPTDDTQPPSDGRTGAELRVVPRFPRVSADQPGISRAGFVRGSGERGAGVARAIGEPRSAASALRSSSHAKARSRSAASSCANIHACQHARSARARKSVEEVMTSSRTA
jgi:hypothetical protein